MPPVSVAIDLPLPRIWGHRPQRLNGISNRLSTLSGKCLHLRMHLPRCIFLLRGQMAEGVHAPQHLLPLLGRQTVKPSKLILQMLLLLWRKVTELGIALQRPSLLFGREIVMLAQPLSGVTLLHSWRTGHRMRGMLFPASVLRPRRSTPA